MSVGPAVLEYLGGRKVLGRASASSPIELHELVAKGLPAASLVFFVAYWHFTRAEISDCLGISPKTFARWKATPRKHIDPTTSDRLIRTAKVLALAEQVLEGADAARGWMDEPQVGLGNKTPKELLTTHVGTREVEELLLRMEHGFLA